MRYREILYHGSKVDNLDRFDMSKAKTAKHIYTSPDRETAQGYGKFLYRVYGSTQPQFRLDPEYTVEEAKVYQTLFDQVGYDFDFGLDFDEFVHIITGGQMYQVGGNQHFQNAILDELFSMGYRSVRMTDMGFGGGMSVSVVFNNPDGLRFEKL